LIKFLSEHKLRKIRLTAFIFAAALHGLLFFFVSVKYQNHTVFEQRETASFKLVNIHIEEAEPPKVSKSLVRKTVQPPPYIRTPEQEASAENFVEIEEAPAVESVVSEYEENPVGEPAPDQYALDGEGEKSGGENKGKADTAKNSNLAREYVRRNFDYISRRVRSKLVYPAQARRTGLDGMVEVSFTLNIDGSVSGVSIKKSSGSQMLDEAATAAIKSAAPFRAPPVSTKLLIPVVFNLRQ
jgi:protein TonB